MHGPASRLRWCSVHCMTITKMQPKTTCEYTIVSAKVQKLCVTFQRTIVVLVQLPLNQVISRCELAIGQSVKLSREGMQVLQLK